MSGKFYVTTPIYYVNDVPHIGHAYTTIIADVLARYHRRKGEEVFFQTGTDENSQKNVEAAEKFGYDGIQDYLDMMAGRWRQTWVDLGLTHDSFIRTTEERHRQAVVRFWQAVKENSPDDIYRGEYVGLYCVGCEKYVTQAELTDEGHCPLHSRKPQEIREQNWFFRLSAYRDRLLQWIDGHPEFIQPVGRRNEVRSYVERFMEDISISRQTQAWGIAVPDDPESVLYVWFDALINYLSGVGYGTDEERFAKWWPADLHLVGKDIIKFHCALWPAMLMAAGLEPPRRVFAHGFFTVNGQKMSKSIGNVISPQDIVARFGQDSLRYYLAREITFGEDGDFSLARLEQRYANDLANELGNLVHRCLSMTDKYLDGRVPAPTADDRGWPAAWAAYDEAMDRLDFGTALDVIWGGTAWDGPNTVRAMNQYIDEKKPWLLAKESDKNALREVIYALLEGCRQVAWGIRPFMPRTSDAIFCQLGIPEEPRGKTWPEARPWSGLKENGKISKGKPIFPRLESENNG